MRLHALRLSPFGAISELSLAWQPGRLHLVYGGNEAGKSTCRAALRAALWGFPKARGHAGHVALMGGQNARVGLRFSVADEGTPQEWVRQPRSLSDAADGRAVSAAEALWADFSEQDYDALFSLDTESLRLGASKLGQRGNRLGEALVAAVRSGTDVHRVLEGLQKRADELYRPRGQLPKVNALLRKAKEAEARRKELQVEPRAAERARAELAEAEAERAAADEALAAAQQALRDAERVQRLAGLAEQLAACDAELATWPAPPPGAAERLDAAHVLVRFEQNRQDMVRAQGAVRAAHAQREAAQHALQELAPEAQFAAQRDAVERVRAAVQACLHGEQAAHAWRQRHGAMAPSAAPAPQAQGLVGAEALEALSEARERSLRAREQVARLQRELTALRGAPAAAESVERAPESSEVWDALRERVETLRGTAHALHQRHTQLAAQEEELDAQLGEEGAHRALSKASLPSVQHAQEMWQALQALRAELRRAQADLRDAESAHERAKGQLQSLLSRGRVPDLAELHAARDARDQLLAAWEALEPEAVRRAVAHADQLADALREGATRLAEQQAAEQVVAERAIELAARQSQSQSVASEVHTQLVAVQARLQALPGPLRLADELLRACQFGERAQELCRQRLTWQREQAELSERVQAMWAKGTPLDEGVVARVQGAPPWSQLDTLHEHVRHRLERIQAAHQVAASDRAERQALDKQRHALQAQLAEAEAEQRAADEALRRVADELGAPEEDLGEVQGFLRAARERLAEQAKRAAVQEEGRLLEGTWQRAQAALREAFAALDVDLDAALWAPAHHADQLSARLHHAVRAEERQRVWQRDHDLQAQALELAEAELEAARRRWAGGLEQVLALGVAPPAEGEDEDAFAARAAERLQGVARHQQRTQWRAERLAEARHWTAPHPAEPLLARAAAAEPEALQAQCDAAQLACEHATQRQIASVQRETTARHALEQLSSASSAASEAEFQSRERRAEATQGAVQWLQARLAYEALEEALRRFGQLHEAPVLAHGSAALAELTAQRYLRLVPQVDELGAVTLHAERADEALLPVSQLSEGTRDQVFLALRLGALRARVADERLPLPVVLDDVLMSFDDQRAVAALRAMCQLLPFTDVVYFTHHEHLLTLAAEALPQERLDLVRLQDAAVRE